MNVECAHSKATQLLDYNFENKPIILAAEYSNNAIYNFIVPLRASSIDMRKLHPILFMFENE
jgi:hypothetical protein